ncbi:MAG TPA: PaaI family thioesterase [Polyangiales bacterium]
MHRPSAEEIQRFITEAFPQDDRDPVITIDSVSATQVRVRLQVTDRHLRPGASISGPIQMAMADTAAWALVLHNLGFAAAASVTSNLNISFLSRPGPEPLVAEGTLLKLGKRLSVAQVRLFSEGSETLVAHATVTYAVIVREKVEP